MDSGDGMGKMKVVGIVFLIIAIIGVILGAVAAFSLPWFLFLSDGLPAEEYDDWIEDPSRRDGDIQAFRGNLGKKDSGDLGGTTFYVYKFEGCDNSFLSSMDVGDEGDYVLLEIKAVDVFGSMQAEVYTNANYMYCTIPGFIMIGIFALVLVISIILVVIGVKQDRLAGPKQQPTQDLSQATAIVQQVQQQEQMYQQQQQPQYGYGGQQGYGGAPPPSGGQRMCQRCGGPARFYPDRNVYWCDRGSHYA